MSQELTGRKVFAIVAGGFAIVIAANMTMLYFSTQTFPGLVVKNSYVASQSFDQRVTAQRALGWTAAASLESGEIVLNLTDAAGGRAIPAELSAQIGRPTIAAKPIDLQRDRVTGIYHAAPELAPGLWQLDILAKAADGTAYEAHFDLIMPQDKR